MLTLVALKKQVEADGYALIRDYKPDDFSEGPICALGNIAEFCRDRPVHDLTPRHHEMDTPNTYSGIYGLGAFPLHTDFAHWPLPPRFVILRCKIGFDDVATRLLDGQHIVNAIGHSTAFRSLLLPRRPVAGTLPLLRLLSRPTSSTTCLRWDATYLRPASSAGQIGYEQFAALLDERPVEAIALSMPGDTLVIDNWRMLHGRSPIPMGREGRILQRAYLEDLH